MMKTRVKRLWSKHNIPMEILSEILARLPVRSLVRFRCVSRSWKTVIDDPDFCRDHLERFKNNCDETHLLIVQDGRQCFVRYSNTMKTSRRLGSLMSWDKKTREWKSTATPGFNGIWKMWFSVDGLVMLKCYSLDKLMLWNPSIRKYRLVPDLLDDTEFVELGLGFDPLIKDYKLVRVSRSTSRSVKIYIVGTSSWKTVAAQETVWSSSLATARWSGPVYFKGCLYVLSSTKLVLFDLSKEVFKSAELPEYENPVSVYFPDSLAFVDGGSSLAVLHFSPHGGSVWVLDDNADVSTWSMRCTFSMSVPRFLYLKKNGDLLFERIDARRDVVSYNLHTGEERLTKYPKTTSRIFDYKESLVLLSS